MTDEEQPTTAPAPSSEAVGSRFPETGDPRVDQVIAHLPDPEAHRHRTSGNAVGDGSTEQSGEDPLSGESLPDPALLDEHITDVTSVHRQLQQRLSDLSN